MAQERELVQRAASGDEKAFEQLVLLYQKPLYNLALRMCGSREDAFDLTQEAFLKAWRGLKQFQFESSFSTWLYRLASNVCIDYLRKQKRQQTVALHVSDDEAGEQTLDLPDPTPGPEARAIRQEQQQELQEAMEQLDPEYREILTLRVINGLRYTQIAEILDVREGTVKSRLFRAREQLRKNLLAIGNKKPARTSKQVERGQDA